ncbi:MAG: ATP-binding protein [Nitrospirae bacterium]|nr:ATP-binding protein [Nitrospirota bacterium]
MTPYKSRLLVPALERAMKSMPVVVISGMRQAGKTTLVRMDPLFKGRAFVSLDDLAHLEAARRNPEDFVRRAERFTIDEAQRCPELLLAIKREVDEHRRPGQFVLTGSANFLLMRNVSDSLAGRAVYLTLHPFTRSEVRSGGKEEPLLIRIIKALGKGGGGKGSSGQEEAIRNLCARIPERKGIVAPSEILRGGMPSVVLGDAAEPDVWFSGFEQTYLERDLRELRQLPDLLPFRRLLHLTALRTGSILNLTEVGRDARLNHVTTRRYLDLMVLSHIVHEIPPYARSRSARLIKSPKCYLSDSGLAAYLAGVDVETGPGDTWLWGRLLETYVMQNVLAMASSMLPGARVYYWHVQGRYEVDTVIEWKGHTLALEIKGSSRWDNASVAGLMAFKDAHKNCGAAILAYNGREWAEIEKGVFAIPLARLLE